MVYYVDIVSNGFKIRNTTNVYNTSSGIYIYAAFAENPFKYALARGSSPSSFSNYVISVDTNDFNLRSAAISAGWDGVAPLNMQNVRSLHRLDTNKQTFRTGGFNDSDRHESTIQQQLKRSEEYNSALEARISKFINSSSMRSKRK